MRKRWLGVGLTVVLCLVWVLHGQEDSKFKLDYQKYTLENGLDVVLHRDTSDPIVAVAVVYHVGSNREKPGRTGFAHLFEHMMFQESEHVGQDQLFKKIQEAGGTLNGFTTHDATCYFEVVPKNALEMVLWLESDRMGFLLGTVTQEAFANQQEVVQNEKRQRVDNMPYGHTSYVIHKNLYPENHPYNWQVIGSLDDLRNATLQDVRDFFTRWYGANNATLVIAGDFDPEQTRAWVKKYFGEIKPSQPTEAPKPWNVKLDETRRVFHEDNFAKSPELNMVFPTVQEYHEDAYALDYLGRLLSEGKKTPLYKVIVEEKKLAPDVSAFQLSREITGYFRIRVRAFPNRNLTEVEKAIFEAFERFEEEGFTDEDLARIRAKTETSFYNRISSVLNKGFQLAFYNEYAGSPGFITQDLENMLSVTKEDVWRVYNAYIKDKPYVLTSFVPKGQTDLVAENSERFPVEEEDITEASEVAQKEVPDIEIEDTPSSFDRSVEPPLGPEPTLDMPTVWKHKLANGLELYGIEHRELPLLQFSITLEGGMVLDDLERVGVANLLSDLLMEGTKHRTPQELEEAIDALGASVSINAADEYIVLRANCLADKFDGLFALVQEILLEPRWDEKEFARLKEEVLERINRRRANPSSIATDVFNKLVYGHDHILAYPTLGTTETVDQITMDDLKAYYEANFSPSVAYASIVGDVSRDQAVEIFGALEDVWPAKEVALPELTFPSPAEEARLYFVDVPKAKQSQIRIGYLALPYTHPDYFPVTVMNYKLGGSFNGILNLILREEKGYTYGARSRFQGSGYPGPFVASSAVRTNATFESVKIFKEEMTKYREGISEEDLEFTKRALIRSNARRFETLGALLGMLNEMARYDLPEDYIEKQEQMIRDMTLERHKELAQKYIVPRQMNYLVVGDAETQMEPLTALGLGDPIPLNEEGELADTDGQTTVK